MIDSIKTDSLGSCSHSIIRFLLFQKGRWWRRW